MNLPAVDSSGLAIYQVAWPAVLATNGNMSRSMSQQPACSVKSMASIRRQANRDPKLVPFHAFCEDLGGVQFSKPLVKSQTTTSFPILLLLNGLGIFRYLTDLKSYLSPWSEV